MREKTNAPDPLTAPLADLAEWEAFAPGDDLDRAEIVASIARTLLRPKRKSDLKLAMLATTVCERQSWLTSLDETDIRLEAAERMIAAIKQAKGRAA